MSKEFEAAWKAYGDNWPSDKPDFRRVWNAAIEAAAKALEQDETDEDRPVIDAELCAGLVRALAAEEKR